MYPGVELLGHLVFLCLISQGLTILFSTALLMYILYIIYYHSSFSFNINVITTLFSNLLSL